MKTFYAMIRRVDGSEFHAATVIAESKERAAKAYAPDYGFGTYFTEMHPQARFNIRAVEIIAAGRA